MKYQTYYGEDSQGSRLGSKDRVDEVPKASPGVPGGDRGKGGDILSAPGPGSGRYFSIWKAGLPDGYERVRTQGVSAIRAVSGGTVSDFFKLKWL